MIALSPPRPHWYKQFWDDLQPTPGRLAGSLRIVLSTVIALVLLMTLRMEFASIGLYFIFLIGRDSPSVSLRSGVVSFVIVIAAVAVELGVVILTDNDPMARLLSVALVTFISGILVVGTNLPALGSSFGLIFVTVIAFWENHAPADFLVKASLKLLATFALSVGCAIAVEYIFGEKNPAKTLNDQRRMRFRLLANMFKLYAEGAPPQQIFEAVTRVSRLALAGQAGMMQLYNAIVDRNLDTGKLPIATRTRITMLAQLMDVSAAFGLQNVATDDPTLRLRCARIAQHCEELITETIPQSASLEELHPLSQLSLLDRVESSLHAILTMPLTVKSAKDRELVALPSSKAPFFIPGVMQDRATVAFGLKISLCATLCYIIYHAIDLPGISTSVITVIVTGLSSSGAIKQRLLFRLIGATIGGLILGLGSTACLFPHVDSITSLVVLVSSIALLSAWVASGPRFNYVGLQIAFAFYLVAFEGFSSPVHLEPARDRLVGILLALVIIWLVFDQIWPVRTTTVMRRAFASVLEQGASLFELTDTGKPYAEIVYAADVFRDRLGKTVAGIRQMKDSVNYEFGSNRERHMQISEILLRSTITAAALFWNQLVALHSGTYEDLIRDPELQRMRRKIATHLKEMAAAVLSETPVVLIKRGDFCSESACESLLYGEYVNNTLARYDELQTFISTLPLKPGLPLPVRGDKSIEPA
jgi:multidrug resistance protein MdtO